jgi:hypothetical protein
MDWIGGMPADFMTASSSEIAFSQASKAKVRCPSKSLVAFCNSDFVCCNEKSVR